MKSVLQKIGKHWKLCLLIVVLIFGIYYYFGNKSNNVEYITDKAAKERVERIVSVNGTVESEKKMDLQFQKSGQIAEIPVKVGEQVKKGDILARLDSNVSEISIRQAKAVLDQAQANLNLQYVGPSDEEIRISKAQIQEAQVNLDNSSIKLENTKKANAEKLKQANQSVQNAEIDLENAQKQGGNSTSSQENNLEKAQKNLDDSYEDAKSALLNTLNALESNITAADSVLGIDVDIPDAYKSLIGAKDWAARNSAENSYRVNKTNYNNFKTAYYALQANWNNEGAEKLLTDAEANLISARDLADQVYYLLDNSAQGQGLSLADIEALKTKTFTEKTSLSSNLSSVQSVQQAIENAQLEIETAKISSGTQVDSAQASIDSAENALELAKKNLESVIVENDASLDTINMEISVNKVRVEQTEASYEKLTAAPRDVDVAALRAGVEQAKASYDKALEDYNDSLIKAPLDGLITDIAVDEGENVLAGQNVIIMMTDQLHIIANISETDIFGVSIDDTVDITLDAFSLDDHFSGKVVEIDPAETVVQGVIYYQTTVAFDEVPADVKSGMTTNMDILADAKDDVLAVPPEAVHYDNNQAFVFVVQNNTKERKDVVIGLEGEDYVEIKSGINEGDDVLLFEQSKN